MVNHKEKRSAGGRRDRVERRAGTPVWIFGYGSLLRAPRFAGTEVRPAPRAAERHPRAAARHHDTRPVKARKSSRDAWLFAYGSLIAEGIGMAAERYPARLFGYHRSLCIYSHVYRGTKECPGLVLGLEPGGSCRGVAFRIPASRAKAAIARVTARENVTGVYLPRDVSPMLLGKGKTRARRVRALVFVADRGHPQYAGKLSPRALARCLHEGKGTKGRASDYLRNVLDCLANLGIRDRGLERIGKLVKNAMR